jgi:glycosyltransferase involved in cell wall biosynthesis
VASASIVIPTRDRPGYLDVTLSSIVPQSRAAGAEVIVVDDGSSADEVHEISERHGARFARHDTPRGPNAARNTGIAAAEAELFVLVDDDVEAPPRWLDALLRGAEEGHEVLGGPIRARLEGSRLRHCGREGPPIASLDLGPADCYADFVWSANMAIHRRALERVGWFDPSYEIYGDEEEWQRRHKRAGGRVRYLADAWLYHRRTGRDARLGALSRAAYRQGRHSRRFDVRKGTAPSLRAEGRTVAGCVWHIARRRCGNGIVLTAHSAGRLREALGALNGTRPEQPSG